MIRRLWWKLRQLFRSPSCSICGLPYTDTFYEFSGVYFCENCATASSKFEKKFGRYYPS